MTILETNRLLLEETQEQDILTLHETILSHEDIMRWVFSGGPMSLAESKEFIHERFNIAKDQTGIATLKRKSDHQIVGFAGLNKCRPMETEELELGFVLSRSNWGMGYATEIGRAQIDFGFQQLNRDCMLAMAHPQNQASLAVMKKLGMQLMGQIDIENRGPRSVYHILNLDRN